MAARGVAVVDVGVLGPLRVRVDGDWMAIRARRQRLVFGVLLAHRGAAVEAERLVHEVWAGDPPPTGLQSLRYHVFRLRDLLEPGRAPGRPGPIATEGSGYRLQVEDDRIDAERFDRHAARGARLVTHQQWDRAVASLDHALALWRGDAWQDFRYQDFAQAAIHHLEERRIVCLEDRMTARLGRGEHHDLVPDLRELTSRYPLHENFWAQLMIALSRAGRGAEAAEAYEHARGVLGEELAVSPNPALARLRDRIVTHALPIDGPSSATLRARPLPRRTSTFVGRATELADLEVLLAQRRLVTVTGPGGVGKTSLAVESARLAGSSLGQVAFVPLESVSRDEDVGRAVVGSLGVPSVAGRPTLADAVEHVGDDQWLLLVDNCEHVAAPVARLLRSLLPQCPGLTVLATSRRALNVDGEHVCPLDALSMPTSARSSDVADAEAVRLFVDRAAAARGAFQLTVRNARLVVELCRRLDALPLALELAASRLRVLQLDELLDQLDRPLDVLVDGPSVDSRHATLAATLQWSHDLLSDRAAILFRRLAVFEGSFDRDAVAAVCAGPGLDEDQVEQPLDELVESSLVQRPPEDESGLVILQTIRAFARQRLEAAEDANTWRERHARYFADRLVEAPRFGGAEHLQEIRRLRVDADNHAAALDWAFRWERHALALRLVAGAPLYWYGAPRGNDQLRWLAERIGTETIEPSPQFAAALCTLGLSLAWMGLGRDAEAVLGALVRVAAHLDKPEHHADVLWVRGALATVAGKVAASRDLFAAAVGLLRTHEHPKLTNFLFDLAGRELQLGNTSRATGLTDELQAVALRHGQPLGEARVPLLRGRIAFHRGDVREGLDEAARSLADVRTLRLVGPQIDPLVTLCDIGSMSGSWEVAETSARGLRRLVAANGEIVARPFADAALASGALARADITAASRHVLDGLSVTRRTRTHVALDRLLLAAARVARAQGRTDVAADLWTAREARRRRHGLVDPLPVTHLTDREFRRHEQAAKEARSAPQDLTDRTAVRMAIEHMSL